MTEVDYQLALLLQNKYEQERRDCDLAKSLQKQLQPENIEKTHGTIDLSDSVIAKTLQEQFQREIEVEQPGHNLAYGVNKQEKCKDSSKSLTDPSWEVIDPTPDIHNLFIAFNERFFWNQLGSVCVCWSKRMTTCAGVCSYQGRGGLCTISLSEPLLKLRPRKDLVETLLHEMIHAYLFITNNNRDRDGHGPEFLRHMKRINDEAGTNITVYHDFHDEVNLYKQHWWRCNGPCNKRKPFFGLVRRAMNRPPGPNDFWWAEHSRTCNGQFIKVKEPEKVQKGTKSKTQTDPKSPDIRSFFPSNKSNSTSSNNIQTIITSNQQKVNKPIPNSNIFGFKNLDKENINKDEKKNVDIPKPLQNKDVNTGYKLISNSLSKEKDYSIVRNHWINKFPSNNTNTKKRISSEPLPAPTEKLSRLSESLIPCPVCSKKVVQDEINQHLDECLNKNESKLTSTQPDELYNYIETTMEDSFNDDVFKISVVKTSKTKKCDVCKTEVPEDKFDMHLNDCLHTMFNRIENELTKDGNQSVPSTSNSICDKTFGNEEKVECLACNKNILKFQLNDHLEDCMSQIFRNETEPLEGTSDIKTMYNCPSCMKLVHEIEMNDHIDICLKI
ncbi:DNA-dependent metalloprotease dvc-1 [Diorhabda sublineata]|uniref:DNA-dependent metalloprotease dvc-1 n=1 Tax=Diorhabda sublineata TaxID=1163346 RepID=UPI0024E145AE|nr:DNA-dependent metalloprotease dvc-1 [Diorhabda sublineata]